MFASEPPTWTSRLRRAAALVKAFALLEDPPRDARRAATARLPASAAPPSAPAAPSSALRPAAVGERAPHSDRGRAHPHRLALVTTAAPRRPGAPPARPQPCTMPIVRTPRRTQRSKA
ncbi:MAG TPA: hypothetical protein VL120_15110 [Solirubrobacteraceae bacterium]|nr:hypothetical protein [Solirubrobacteraceae bacterium]